jgi:CBS domain-containing protein
MSTAGKLLKAKEVDNVLSVATDDSVYKALKVMAQANISAVLVKEGEKFVGIFTERDYCRKVELEGKRTEDALVKEVMTTDMITVSPATSVNECMGLMMKYHVRHLPVVKENHIVGVLSMRDIIEEVLENKDSVIAQLENYITGNSFAT